MWYGLLSSSAEERKEQMDPYWGDFKPFYLMFRLLGHIPYKEDNVGGIFVPVWAGLWAVVSALAQVILSRLEVEKDLEGGVEMKILYSRNNYHDAADILFLAFTAGQFAVSWRQVPHIIMNVNDWNTFTSRYEIVTGYSVPSLGSSTPIYVVCSLVPVVFGLVVLEFYFTQDCFDRRLVIIHFFVSYHSSLLAGFWISNCTFIGRISDSLRKHFSHSVQISAQPHMVNCYRLLWLHLQHKVTDLADAFSGSLLMLLLGHTLCLFLSSNRLLAAVLQANPIAAVAYALLQLLSTLGLLAACLASHHVTYEVGRQFSAEILSVKISSQRFHVTKQVDLFLETVSASYPDICLAGVLHLNRSLVLRILVVTTIFILLSWKTQLTER